MGPGAQDRVLHEVVCSIHAAGARDRERAQARDRGEQGVSGFLVDYGGATFAGGAGSPLKGWKGPGRRGAGLRERRRMVFHSPHRAPRRRSRHSRMLIGVSSALRSGPFPQDALGSWDDAPRRRRETMSRSDVQTRTDAAIVAAPDPEGRAYKRALWMIAGGILAFSALQSGWALAVGSRQLLKDGLDWVYDVALYGIAAFVYRRGVQVERWAAFGIALILAVAGLHTLYERFRWRMGE